VIFLLDTDTLIYILKRRPPSVAARVERLSPEGVAVSAISMAELTFGAEKSAHPTRSRRAVERVAEVLPVLPFDADAARAYGRLRRHLEQRGTPIGALDTLIAAHALALRATLVTNNTREFTRVPGLKVENWVDG